MKYLRGIIWTCLMLAAVVLITPEAKSEVIEIDPGHMVLQGEVMTEDFFEFYRATLDESVRHYRIVLHTPGGNASSTIGIINRIIEMKATGITFTTEVYGVAASAGSYIFIMGDERVMHSGSILMWHTLEGQTKDRYLPEDVRVFFYLCDSYIRKMFKRVTGMSDEMVYLWLDAKEVQWMSALTAYNVGIATKLVEN